MSNVLRHIIPKRLNEVSNALPFSGTTTIYVAKASPNGSTMGVSYTKGFPAGAGTDHLWEEGWSIHLDYLPPPQGRPRVTSKGTYNPQQADMDALHWRLKAKRPFQNTLEGPLLLMVHFVYPMPQRPKYPSPATRPDLDNRVKLVLDAGNGCLWYDDSQVVELHTSKSYRHE